jgi:hypothetical protein
MPGSWGTFTDDVSALSTLDGVVRTMASATDALQPRMVRAYLRFWPLRILQRRHPLQECRPPIGQKEPKTGKSDSLVSLKITVVPGSGGRPGSDTVEERHYGQ